ncbi:MAG: class I SAM-dependent methyltransferase [Candidatus Omnitrophica bacterium]|nr:class I SAM-dependent methyltransferase [Candidatus Omnitrophota bacterium]
MLPAQGILIGRIYAMSNENLWERYWRIFSLKRWLIEMIREVYFASIFSNCVKNFLKGGRVLEAGCGSAKILEKLGKGYIRVGCDISHNAVMSARKRCKNLIICDIKKLPFRDDSFDLIFNQGVMEHFDDAETINILTEFKRVSKNVLIIVPANTSVFRIYNPFDDAPDATFFTPNHLRTILKKIFKIVKVNYISESFFISIAGYGSG